MNNAYRIVESYHRQQLFDFWSRYCNPFWGASGAASCWYRWACR